MNKNNDNVGFLLVLKAINNGPVVHPFRASRKLYVQTKTPNTLQKNEKISGVKPGDSVTQGSRNSKFYRLELDSEVWNEIICRVREPAFEILSCWAEFWGVKRETLSHKRTEIKFFIIVSRILRRETRDYVVQESPNSKFHPSEPNFEAWNERLCRATESKLKFTSFWAEFWGVKLENLSRKRVKTHRFGLNFEAWNERLCSTKESKLKIPSLWAEFWGVKRETLSRKRVKTHRFGLDFEAWNERLCRARESKLKFTSFWAEFWGVKRETLSRNRAET